MTLRSGGADGADAAFEAGAGDDKQIFLPWKRFNRNMSPLYTPSVDAYAVASRIHPVWDRLSSGAKLLHARNVHQVLGPNLNEPSEFLVCWTMGGGVTGGTATAIKVALEHGVPVYNAAPVAPAASLPGVTRVEVDSLEDELKGFLS